MIDAVEPPAARLEATAAMAAMALGASATAQPVDIAAASVGAGDAPSAAHAEEEENTGLPVMLLRRVAIRPTIDSLERRRPLRLSSALATLS